MPTAPSCGLITPGDTALTNAEFLSVVRLARHVLAVSKGPEKQLVTVRDVTFAAFILELVEADAMGAVTRRSETAQP